MIPRTPQQIRDWLDRIQVSHALAAVALGLRNPDTVMREYCSDRRHPTETTRMHMDLLETLIEARRSVGERDMARTMELLDHALSARGLIDAEIDTTPLERTT